MYFRFSLLSLILIMGCGNSVWSKSIHVPDEELARETVLPKFDSIISVFDTVINISTPVMGRNCKPLIFIN